MKDTQTWDTLTAELREIIAERDRLKAELAGYDCTKCGCIRQSSERKQLIYIAQPYGGREENMALARKYTMALQECHRDKAFISPVIAYGHTYSVHSYDRGIGICLDLLAHCDQLWIIGDDGISKGVKLERQWAQEHGIPIKEFETQLDAVEGKKII